jgi:hypothetical protein
MLLLTGPLRSRFVPDGPDVYRGLDGYFAGERLRVIRQGSGVVQLDLATFVLTRTPYGR